MSDTDPWAIKASKTVVAGYDINLCISCNSANLAAPKTFVWTVI